MGKIDGIMYVYKMMKKVKEIDFKAESLADSHMDWNYNGKGNVIIKEECNKLYFSEEIVLDNNMKYSDKKLWEFREDCIKFYRFRNGKYENIFDFLFQNGEFVMKREYVCVPDLYYGEFNVLNNGIYLLIKVKGEKKNEVLKYIYLRRV